MPNWDNAKAGTIFQQLLTAAGNKVDGVIGSNDGMAQSIITRLKAVGIKAPVTGQDATPDGLRSVLLGDQCMTVYKAVKAEAKAAADAAVALINGHVGHHDRHHEGQPVRSRRPVGAPHPGRDHGRHGQGRRG